jgi:methylase of polypeptide subunit release factors
MISTDCRIESFLAAIEGKSMSEAVLLAHQEATEAERRLLRSRIKADASAPCPDVYINRLKEFIGFARYAVMQYRTPKDEYHNLFRSYVQRNRKKSSGAAPSAALV